MNTRTRITDAKVRKVAEGARDRSPVEGYTHNFYRYPARFSPAFASAAIESFTEPGDLVCEPYMGGGTAVVQSMAKGRHVVGNDLNSLATFITQVKTTPLTTKESRAVTYWAQEVIPTLNYRSNTRGMKRLLNAPETFNLSLVRARYIKKLIASSILTFADLPSKDAENFIRCALLRVGQWALDGRKTHMSLEEFRANLQSTLLEMLRSIEEFERALDSHKERPQRVLETGDAGNISNLPVFATEGRKARLVVTSPPYPGVHVLYHRWQVDGRRESPAPYWIANRSDGEGYAYYNFGGRAEQGAITYFNNSLRTLTAIRKVMMTGGVIVQMVAFGDPRIQLPAYLANMEQAGFSETSSRDRRIWRQVPHRKWHATLQGRTHSAREVVLIHRAS